MKNIPLIRKLKYNHKAYQRSKNNTKALIESLQEMNLTITSFTSYLYSNSTQLFVNIPFILNTLGSNENSLRFSRLCRRLAKAAKKQNKCVDIYKIYKFIKGLPINDVILTDARDIPFEGIKKTFKVTKSFINTNSWEVFAISEADAVARSAFASACGIGCGVDSNIEYKAEQI